MHGARRSFPHTSSWHETYTGTASPLLIFVANLELHCPLLTGHKICQMVLWYAGMLMLQN